MQEGYTALMLAASAHKESTSQLLIASGANLSVLNEVHDPNPYVLLKIQILTSVMHHIDDSIV